MLFRVKLIRRWAPIVDGRTGRRLRKVSTSTTVNAQAPATAALTSGSDSGEELFPLGLDPWPSVFVGLSFLLSVPSLPGPFS